LSEKKGITRIPRIRNVIPTADHGWLVTHLAHPPQKPRSTGFGFGRRKAGTRAESMWRPTAARIAGSSVIAASTAVRTARADA
jgi:hypothetical protein